MIYIDTELQLWRLVYSKTEERTSGENNIWAIGREDVPVADFSKFQNTLFLSGI